MMTESKEALMKFSTIDDPPSMNSQSEKLYHLMNFHVDRARQAVYRRKLLFGIGLFFFVIILCLWGFAIQYGYLVYDQNGLLLFPTIYLLALNLIFFTVGFAVQFCASKVLSEPVLLSFVYEDPEEAFAAMNSKTGFLKHHWKRMGTSCLNCCLPLCMRSAASISSELEGREPIAFFTASGVYLTGTGIFHKIRGLSIVAVDQKYYIEVTTMLGRGLVLIPKMYTCHYPLPQQVHPNPLQAALELLSRY
eukprot:TRINITY_DN1058_c0_g1_i1.p1 TRINITY_DN1058_c0_g1~~TRINITY_DN1058_c0_g1_i1.p1  ORF type:complete len:249 (+),score=45.12 TRINITY_DN1058_c0_g1_i1:76-822(+)